MEQKISLPSSDMLVYIESKRDWVRNHFTPETIDEYNTIEGKLRLLDTILKSGWMKKKK